MGSKDIDEEKPDNGDMVNDAIVDSVGEVMDVLEGAYNDLSRLSGWYNLVKMSDPQGARVLIKFFFLMQEEWLNYGRSQEEIGLFGVVNDKPKSAINLDDIPY